MKKFAALLGALAVAGILASPVQAADDVLFYYGHAGLNEGHTSLAAIYTGLGANFVSDAGATIPADLSPYRLIFISVPGWLDPNAYFSAAETAALNAFLADGAHRIVLIGEWDGFYGQGQQVLEQLASDLGGVISFFPGVFDQSCYAYNCAATNTTDPLVNGLSGLCKAATAVWDLGTAVSYPVENTVQPWVVSNGTDVPCICGIGDSNTLSDPCAHLGDANTAEFASRLYLITCAGEPSPTVRTTWGNVKATYR